MLKIVIDTNVIVSAALHTESLPALLLSLALEDKARLFISPDLLSEYQSVLPRARFKLDPKEIEGLMRKITQKATLVKTTEPLNVIKGDEKDNRILECALKAKANFIITGNKRHFPFEEFKGIKIVTPREFMNKISGI